MRGPYRGVLGFSRCMQTMALSYQVCYDLLRRHSEEHTRSTASRPAISPARSRRQGECQPFTGVEAHNRHRKDARQRQRTRPGCRGQASWTTTRRLCLATTTYTHSRSGPTAHPEEVAQYSKASRDRFPTPHQQDHTSSESGLQYRADISRPLVGSHLLTGPDYRSLPSEHIYYAETQPPRCPRK